MINYLSYTGYKTGRDCLHQFHGKYILREKPDEEFQDNFFKGNALHHLLEGYIDNKADFSWVGENAENYWKAELAAVAKKPKHKLSWDAAGHKKHHDLFIKWAGNLEKLLRDNNLVSTSLISEFNADTATKIGKYRIKMAGRVDVMLETLDGKIAVLDLKASANRSITDWDQLIWYSQLVQLKTGKVVDYVGYILPAFNEVNIHHVPQSSRDALMVRVEEFLQKVDANHFPPGHTDTAPCYFCTYKYRCPRYGGAVEQGKIGDGASVDDLL